MKIPRRRQPPRPSIYEHIRRHVAPGGVGLLESGHELPDDENLERVHGIAFSPGALEGAFVRYWADTDALAASAEETVAELHPALVRLADRPGRRTRERARALMRDSDPRFVVDRLGERLESFPPGNLDNLYSELRAIFLESGDRNEVKVATALLGGFGRQEDAELFRTLARHEEFTLYAALALARTVLDPLPEWCALLPHLSGWGKTELTELMLQDPDLPAEVRDLLLKDGLAIGNALSLAVGCRLDEALEREEVEDELLDGCGKILDALTRPSDSPDYLSDYPDAGRAAELYLEHLERRAEKLEHFVHAYELRRFVEEAPDEEPKSHSELLEHCGFDPDRVERVKVLSARILDRPEWQSLAAKALASEDSQERWNAVDVAKRLGLPLHDVFVRRIERDPLDTSAWYELAHGADESQIDDVLRLAEERLDLTAVASGPALELGVGEGFAVHNCVECVVQELRRFPGRGWTVLRATLRSPVIRERGMAVRALAEWDPDDVTPTVRSALEELMKDPDETIRAWAEAVLRGEPLPDD